MALNKEIWLSTIQENFFPDDSFAVHSVDDSMFVENKTVHIPNAGAPSGVVINRQDSNKGANSGQAKRTDNDLTYNIDELTTNPIYIPEIEKTELSYDKRQSVIMNDRQQLQDTAHQNLLYKWYVKASAIETTGSARAAHTSTTATGTRKAIKKEDVLTIATEFNKMNVPANDRYLLLDAVMYADLLAALTGSDLPAFLASANAQKGIVGNLYGINVMMRSQVLKCKANKDLLEYSDTAVAAECAVGLAWQKNCVSRALGELKMFQTLDDPNWYGDIYSFLLRTGGSPRRYDKLGIIPLVEVAAS